MQLTVDEARSTIRRFVLVRRSCSRLFSVESRVPRFFFDILDAASDQRDELGVECADLEAAIVEAKRALPSIATDELPSDGDHKNYMVVVRDTDGHAVYSAALSFVGTRLIR